MRKILPRQEFAVLEFRLTCGQSALRAFADILRCSKRGDQLPQTMHPFRKALTHVLHQPIPSMDRRRLGQAAGTGTCRRSRRCRARESPHQLARSPMLEMMAIPSPRAAPSARTMTQY